MNHYEILGVRAYATAQQIKEGYRREAMTWHPDRHKGVAAKAEADRRFKDIAQAYRTLRDPAARSIYNQELEEKLRSEFEARLNKQARPEPPRQDFANTGPQFDEQTASSNDANQMFHEQMLDLAAELFGRGFPEFNIWKALVALGCPEPLAKTVATTAAQQGFGNQAKPGPEVHNSEFEKPDSNEEFVVKPKRFFAILGMFFGLFMVLHSIDIWHNSLTIWHLVILIIYGIFGLFILIHWGQISITNTVMVVSHHGIRFTKGGGRIKKWAEVQLFASDEKSIRFSGVTNDKKWVEKIPRMSVSGNWPEIIFRIDQFKNSRSHQPAPTFENTRSVSSLLLWMVGAFGLIGILAAVGLPAYQDYTRRARVAEGFLVGSQAAEKVSQYYAIQKKGPDDLTVAGYFQNPSSTVKNTSYNSQTGVLTILFKDNFFNAKPLMLVPSVTDGKLTWLCTGSDLPVEYLPRACRDTKAEADARLATLDTEQKEREKVEAEYAVAIKAIETQYPELNPNAASFNAPAQSWVADRMAAYKTRRETAINSLRLAVSDYLAGQQRTSQLAFNNLPPLRLDNYLAGLRLQSASVRNFNLFSDMGVKFPIVAGTLTDVTANFRQRFAAQARNVEDSQSWSVTTSNGLPEGVIALQNLTIAPLKGVVLEVQAEERPCANKGKVFYMSLDFNASVASGSVVGVTFAFPSMISSGNRCIDIVDVIPG